MLCTIVEILERCLLVLIPPMTTPIPIPCQPIPLKAVGPHTYQLSNNSKKILNYKQIAKQYSPPSIPRPHYTTHPLNQYDNAIMTT